jgi:hypothetical protein
MLLILVPGGVFGMSQAPSTRMRSMASIGTRADRVLLGAGRGDSGTAVGVPQR